MKILKLGGVFPNKREFASAKNKLIVLWEGFGHKTVYVDSVPQSGYLYRRMWSKAISSLKKSITPKRVLLLGLGGGTVITLLRKKYPAIKITAVEIDQVMVDVYKQYFDPNVTDLIIHVADAIDWISKQDSRNSFDLIIVDLFLGRNNPAQSKTVKFLKSLQKLLHPKGRIWFNAQRDPYNMRNFNLFYKRCTRIFSSASELYKQPYSRLLELTSKQ